MQVGAGRGAQGRVWKKQLGDTIRIVECEADFAEGLTEHKAAEEIARATYDQESKEDEIGIVATTCASFDAQADVRHEGVHAEGHGEAPLKQREQGGDRLELHQEPFADGSDDLTVLDNENEHVLHDTKRGAEQQATVDGVADEDAYNVSAAVTLAVELEDRLT